MTRSFRREEQAAFVREASLDPSPVSLFTRELLPHYDEPRSEGYDEFFDPPLESKYECPICLLGLREPVQTSCGHRFCGGCILRSIRDAGPKCPVDNERLNESQLYPDNFAKREMLSHDVFCRLKKQHGCPWKGPLNKLEDHLSDCEFVELDCPKECGRKLKRKDLKKHLDAECPNRTVPCQYCPEQVKWNGLEEHFRVCPKYPQACEKCGQENIPRDMIDEHLEKECPNTEIECPFHIVGCTFKGLRALVNKHVQEHLTSHLIDMTKAFTDLRAVVVTQPETQTQRSAPRRTRGGTEARPQEQAAQDEYFRELSTQTHHHQGELDELRHTVTTLNNTVHHMERRMEEMRMRQERPIQELTMRFNRYEAKLLEYEGRVCNGAYIWRIENYRQCRQDAINGVMTAIHSPAFHTSLYGYKLCMRINLNGVDSGVGKHVALFVHMMQGDYDTILEWPFTGRIALSILDQSDASEFRHHISETLVAKPNLLAFQRPTAPRNYKGYGYVEFAPIEQIREGQYVKNNVMLVRIQIFH